MGRERAVPVTAATSEMQTFHSETVEVRDLCLVLLLIAGGKQVWDKSLYNTVPRTGSSSGRVTRDVMSVAVTNGPSLGVGATFGYMVSALQMFSVSRLELQLRAI